MPWNRKTASRSVVITADEAEERSAAIECAFSGYFDPRGIGGSNMSVRVTLYSGERSSSFARIWPMKPPAPVMRICIVVDLRFRNWLFEMKCFFQRKS